MIAFSSASRSIAVSPEPKLSQYAWQCIGRKAARLSCKPGFTRADRDDLAQELALRLWSALRNFDPARGKEQAFIATVLKRAGASLLRKSCSRRRGRRLKHLAIICAETNDLQRSADAELTCALCATNGSSQKAFDLSHDVAVMMEHLPVKLRTLAEQLKEHSVTEIAERRGVSRFRIYAEIEVLRAQFAELRSNDF
jgi:RNA polymerase sigma factor (sigma-70 family)